MSASPCPDLDLYADFDFDTDADIDCGCGCDGLDPARDDAPDPCCRSASPAAPARSTLPGRRLARLASKAQPASRSRQGRDQGMSTAEYAVGTVAACGFAALLWTVLHSAAVQHALLGLITHALGLL